MTLDFNCCEQFFFHLREKEKIIVYEAKFRHYLLRPNYYSRYVIHFCPWCGAELPQSLREKHFQVLDEEYGMIAETNDYQNDPNIPDEFESEEWWRKRGL